MGICLRMAMITMNTKIQFNVTGKSTAWHQTKYQQSSKILATPALPTRPLRMKLKLELAQPLPPPAAAAIQGRPPRKSGKMQFSHHLPNHHYLHPPDHHHTLSTIFTITIIQHFLLAPAARASLRKDAMRLISCEVQFVPDINFIQCVKFVVLNYSTQRLDDRKGC